ncbi:MAG: DMT family transporter [Oligoflexales bacterium]
MQPLYRACIQLVVSQVAFGANVALSKKLAATWSASAIVSSRFLIAGAFLAALMYLQKGSILVIESTQGPKLKKRDWGLLVGQAIFGGILFNAFFQTGLMHVSTCCAGLLSSAFPMVMATCAFFLLDEKITPQAGFGILLTVFGIVTIHIDFDQTLHAEDISVFGTALILFALIPEALASILARKQRGRITPLGAAAMVNLIGAIFTFPMMLTEIQNGRMPISSYTVTMISIASMCTMLFYTGWLSGLKTVEASTAGIFVGIMPLSAAMFGALLLEETPSWNEALAAGFILISIIVAAYGAKSEATQIAHEPAIAS